MNSDLGSIGSLKYSNELNILDVWDMFGFVLWLVYERCKYQEDVMSTWVLALVMVRSNAKPKYFFPKAWDILFTDKHKWRGEPCVHIWSKTHTIIFFDIEVQRTAPLINLWLRTASAVGLLRKSALSIAWISWEKTSKFNIDPN